MSEYEIRLDTDAVLDGAQEVANLVKNFDMAYFDFAAFGTGWGMVVTDHRGLHGAGFSRPSGMDDSASPYLLWTRYGPGNWMHGCYLRVGQTHVPDYLQEKFSTSLVDGLGIGLMIGLVEHAWMTRESPEGWIPKGRELIERSGMRRARPALDDDLPSFWKSE